MRQNNYVLGPVNYVAESQITLQNMAGKEIDWAKEAQLISVVSSTDFESWHPSK